MKVSFYTLGCKVNQYETEAVENLFTEAGYSIGSFDDICDIYVVNTCSITHVGDKKSRQILRRARNRNRDAVIIAMGCYAQSMGEKLIKETGIDIVMGTDKRKEIVENLKNHKKGNLTKKLENDISYEELDAGKSSERCRAYIKIQDGCNNFCTYCIVPYTRGRSRSRKYENIINEARRLSNDYSEIILTGVDVSSYGLDLNEKRLIDVIEGICEIEKVKRVRISSIDPRAFSDEFIDRISKLDKLCRHFHISLQSGSNGVLKKMNRHYTTEKYLKILSKIREKMPDAMITTDVITGFAEETENEHRETVEFIKKARFLKVHVFPYSERSGTIASKREQIPKNIRDIRAKEVSIEAEKISSDIIKNETGKIHSVLFEAEKNGYFEGLTKNYMRVFVKSDTNLTGKIKNVEIVGVKNKKIFAKVLDN